MKKKRGRTAYSDEFRREAVRLVETKGDAVQVAKDLGVHPECALDMALQHHRPAGGVHHSDRGIQYASHAYRQRLHHAGFATLSKELLGDGLFPTRDAARQAVFEFIAVWYNRRRRHSALGYRTPAEYAEELQKAS